MQQNYHVRCGNTIGGLAAAGASPMDVLVGARAWIPAAAHEAPQELGDFAALVRGGWKAPRALLFNFLSAPTFLAGGIATYAFPFAFDVSFLAPFPQVTSSILVRMDAAVAGTARL